MPGVGRGRRPAAAAAARGAPPRRGGGCRGGGAVHAHALQEAAQLAQAQAAVARAVQALEAQAQVRHLGRRQLVRDEVDGQLLQLGAQGVLLEPGRQEAGGRVPPGHRSGGGVGGARGGARGGGRGGGQVGVEEGVGERGLGGRPSGGVLLQHPEHELARLGWDAGPVLLEEGHGVVQNCLEDVCVRVAHERGVPAQQDVEDDARAPDVALLAEPPPEHLRVDEVGRADQRRHGVIFFPNNIDHG
mmetsp:Transcript_19143/g.31859  ORF Transcript_19143/g.31859 Transcript_19143/m.31859 type:complete len:245 (-) Transcript_19143:176-910(-)